MPSSKTTSGDVYTITEVSLAWTDMGRKMWNIRCTRNGDQTEWFMRHWAKDELDAYKIAIEKLKGASNA